MSRGQYQILYYPQLATAHKVDIKYNGLTVADSPIVLHAKNPGEIGDGGFQLSELIGIFILQPPARNQQRQDWVCTKPGWRNRLPSS